MTSTTAPLRVRRPRPGLRVTAWAATLSLAAGIAISSTPEVQAAPANASSAMQAWGNNDFGQTQLPFDLTSGRKIVSKISLGKHHGVAATTDKSLYAWGQNSSGEGSVPAHLQNLGTIDVAAGDGFNVVLGDDGDARVWGNTPGGLGTVPKAAVDANLLEVAAGANHALVKSSAGKVYAWGTNTFGQTTIPSAVNNTTIQALAAGNGFSMALSSGGKVFAWGNNTHGQATVPASLDGKKVVQIAAGARHALALTQDNEIVAWGSNGEGALNVPALGDGDKWLQIAAGDGFSSGVAKDSPTAGVWGFGATAIRKPPIPLPGTSPVSIVAGGDALVQGFRRLGVTAAPSISGSPRVGSVLTATHATFGPTDDVVKSPEWLKVTNGVVTTVGREMTYTPKITDLGSTLAFRTHASHPLWGTAYNDTAQIEVKGTAFTSVTKPVVTGDAYVGSTLKGSLTSVPAADSYRYDWYADGVYRKTSDAKGEYVVQQEDLGKKITLLGYADKAGYERITAGSSDPTAMVTTAPLIEVQLPPVVKGTPRVGTLLTVTPATSTPTATKTYQQWYRNGVAIAGATGTTYRAAPADAGKSIGVMARLTAPGRSEVIVGSQTVTIAKVTPSLSWKAKQGGRSGSKRKVRISVSVSAPGVPAFGGRVKIRDGSKVVKTLTLKKGKASYVVKLKRGKRTVRVTYYGTTGVNAKVSTRRLKVK